MDVMEELIDVKGDVDDNCVSDIVGVAFIVEYKIPEVVKDPPDAVEVIVTDDELVYVITGEDTVGELGNGIDIIGELYPVPFTLVA
jgi:hypothetical protein